MKTKNKNEKRFEAVKTLNGYSVIDNQSKKPVMPLYYACSNPNHDIDADNMNILIKVAGILNLMHSDIIDDRLKQELESNLANYKSFKCK